MQSNKIDNQIREKLNAREIEPSAKSWDRLDAMLSVQEEKKPKKGFLWLYIAASFIVFFGLGIFLFNSGETSENNNQVPILVGADKTIDPIETNKIDKILIEPEQQQQQQVLVQNEKKAVKKDNSIKEALASSNKANNIQENDNKSNPSYNLQPTTANTYKYISPENLLAEVQNERKNLPSESKINKESSVKIDANALLSTVEKELDDSYRETTLDKLNKSFNAVKTAIVNRNYE